MRHAAVSDCAAGAYKGASVPITYTLAASIEKLVQKGVRFTNPLTVTISEEVDLDRISGEGVTIHPGCRLHGKKTVISAGVKLGHEAPVVIEDCQLGTNVELKGGYFKKATFLEKANLGMGAHVREGCLLEEEANGAHTVGLKQTILFPFVTLGSLINFCDCLMAGGVSRQEHSEVGSSFIHFNYTPEGDKTTASLIGDVPRGVMLNQPPIFLGGQGGIVGPVRVGYGNVLAAGSVLRRDIPEDQRLVAQAIDRSVDRPLPSRHYPTLSRIVVNNVLYLANLWALEEWYRYVRHDFLAAQPLGEFIYEGALDKLKSAREERSKRLKAMAGKMPAALALPGGRPQGDAERARKQELLERIEALTAVFTAGVPEAVGGAARDGFLKILAKNGMKAGDSYLATIQSLTPAEAQEGTAWLQAVTDHLASGAWQVLPSFAPTKK